MYARIQDQRDIHKPNHAEYIPSRVRGLDIPPTPLP
ncbi:hypothetical protein J2S37_000097 [Corynebacterium felinum]|uniref:Uncharacterized protein n=1 Tax=Corynebacterium felinum TaxID=131318 RepID=A0ABU2B4L9_9CORY|nr:hypothetical protein [Corynebacterium felinum]